MPNKGSGTRSGASLSSGVRGKKMNITTRQCRDSEVAGIEQEWIAQGYYLVHKTNSGQLRPMEYMKTSHHGSVHSFDGPRIWTLTRRNKD